MYPLSLFFCRDLGYLFHRVDFGWRFLDALLTIEVNWRINS
ncbi:hypothetical protein CPter91_0005 [Collimonas pratensis]|uniref:Uncharacterized protein n=1 Tax=Collimonas pratensis TaxID=279113 RepID=A0A127PXT8_9BURK|nr:hypothetical protein CPter91_0005 [Collimonas pratensis]